MISFREIDRALEGTFWRSNSAEAQYVAKAVSDLDAFSSKTDNALARLQNNDELSKICSVGFAQLERNFDTLASALTEK